MKESLLFLLKNNERLYFIIFCCLLLFAVAGRVSAAGLERKGRWLMYNGQNIYFVGTDVQSLVADPNIDYAAVLDALQRYRINKFRVWIYAYWGMPGVAYAPWAYSNGRFNLDKFNDAFFTRLQNIAAAAKQRDIIMEVSLFSPYADQRQWDGNYAWNKSFNSNNVFSANSSGHFTPEFFHIGQYGLPNHPEISATGHSLLYYQQTLVDKVVSSLKGNDNVYFEIANEFAGGLNVCLIDAVYSWQRYMADRIKAIWPEALVTAHSQDECDSSSASYPHLGVQYFWDYPSVDILGFHFYSDNPKTISSWLHSSQTRKRILQSNESFYAPNDLEKTTREAWGFFTSGGYYGFYANTGDPINKPEWIPVAQRMKALHDVADTVPWWKMSPVDGNGDEYDSVVSQGPGASGWQVLADPGASYVVYFWGSPSNTIVTIDLPAGAYDYKWFDARNGNVLASGVLTGGGAVKIVPPSSSAWSGDSGLALTILASSAPPNSSNCDILDSTLTNCPGANTLR